MPKPIVAGFSLTLVALAVQLASMILALLGSPLAPSWLQSMIPAYAGMIGVFVLLFATIRNSRATEAQQRVSWRTETTLPADASVAYRRTLTPRRDPTFAWLASTMACFFVLMVIFATYPTARKWGALRRRGVETTGSVRGKRTFEGRTTHYYLDYDYRVADRTIENSAKIAKGRWLTLKAGDPLRITYSPRVPEISLPIARSAMNLSDVFDPVLIVLLCGAGGLLIPMSLLLRRIRRRSEALWRDGTAALATVTAVSGMRVKYAFDAGSGTFVYTSASVPKPAVGDRFVVLYNPERPKESTPWATLRSSVGAGASPALAAEAAASTLPLASLPGHATVSWTLFAALAGLIFISVPIAIRLRSSFELRTRFNLVQRDGRETTGTVVDTRRSPGWPEGSTRVRYRFLVNERSFDSMFLFFSTSLRARFIAGEETPVTYSASNPQRSLPVAMAKLRHVRRSELLFIPFGTFLLLMLTAAAVIAIRRALRELGIARGGRLAIARVEAVTGVVLRRVRYRFVSDHGDVEGSALIQSKLFRPAIGDHIEVIYAGVPPQSIPVGDFLFVKRSAKLPL